MHRAFLCFPGFLFQAMGSRLAYFHSVTFQVLPFPRLLSCLPPAGSASVPLFPWCRSLQAPTWPPLPWVLCSGVALCPEAGQCALPALKPTRRRACVRGRPSTSTHHLGSSTHTPLRLRSPPLQMGRWIWEWIWEFEKVNLGASIAGRHKGITGNPGLLTLQPCSKSWTLLPVSFKILFPLPAFLKLQVSSPGNLSWLSGSGASLLGGTPCSPLCSV